MELRNTLGNSWTVDSQLLFGIIDILPPSKLANQSVLIVRNVCHFHLVPESRRRSISPITKPRSLARTMLWPLVAPLVPG